MSLSHGARLGPYEIVAAIGAGGMGEVYKARDTRLGRTVAIKVLPAGAAADPERRRRFEQEARAVAALNHPHICTLYDIGRDGETDYLVMELVAGETLAARLTKGPLPRAQAIEFATQMAQALARAHGEGIVHRDLKPGNVMLTESGVTLLDFGLAKLTPAGPLAAELSSLPTGGSPVTGQGTIVGTLAYMAPEQLEGKDVDARTDLFAFGAVLYEMLTGRRPFDGSTQASLIAAIMSADPPPLTAFEPLTPPALDRVVRKCLAKDPRARWQSATDLADELKWISTGSGSSASVVAAAVRLTPRRRVWPWAGAAGVLVVAAAAGAWWWVTRGSNVPAQPQEVKHTQLTFRGDVFRVALSPDGATIAYSARSRGTDTGLVMRDVTGSAAVEVLLGLSLNTVAWMPDGKQVLVAGAGPDRWGKGFQVLLVSRFGGAPRRVAGFNVPVATVSPDGKQIAGALETSSGFDVMALDGGPVRSIKLPGLSAVFALRWSQSGKRIAIAGNTPEQTWGVWVVNPDGADLRRVHSGGPGTTIGTGSIEWSPSDDAVYVQCRTGGGVSEVWRISGATGHAPVAKPVLTGLVPSTSLAISADGDRLAQVRTATTANLWRMDLTGAGSAPTQITETSGALLRPHVSPDGRTIAAARGSEILKVPIAGGEPVPIVPGSNGSWSPDGRQFAFVADRGQGPRVFVGDADGQQATEIRDAIPVNNDVLWLPDGRLAWQTKEPKGRFFNYAILDLASGQREFLIEKPVGYTLRAAFAPRGDGVALYWNRQPFGLWVVSGPERKQRLLAAGLCPVGWSSDAPWIYAYRPGTQEVLRVNADTGKVEAVGRFPVGTLGFHACDLTPDRRAIVCSLADSKGDVWIVDHFDPQATPAKK
jgi:Tol biopolymer transport system component